MSEISTTQRLACWYSKANSHRKPL